VQIRSARPAQILLKRSTQGPSRANVAAAQRALSWMLVIGLLGIMLGMRIPRLARYMTQRHKTPEAPSKTRKKKKKKEKRQKQGNTTAVICNNDKQTYDFELEDTKRVTPIRCLPLLLFTHLFGVGWLKTASDMSFAWWRGAAGSARRVRIGMRRGVVENSVCGELRNTGFPQKQKQKQK
jgi:hypothetical protein